MDIHQKNFCLILAITIHYLFTYSVRDEKVNIHMHSEKSTNSFKKEKSIGYLIIYWTIFFYESVHNFPAL